MMRTVLLILLAAAVLGACNLRESPSDAETTPETPQALTPAPSETPAQSSTQESPQTPLPPVTQSITLTIWTSADVAPNNDVPGGAVLLEQLNTFDNEHSGVSLLVELKTISDQGGILSYLRTGRAVAPSILPDIVLLPASQLSTAAGQGLIQPLDGLLAPEAMDDLYPVARSLAQVDEELYGYPFALTNLQHIVYNTSTITRTVSADWDELVADAPGDFLYAAAGVTGAELTAKFYHALGGQFSDEAGQPQLQTEPLVGALELLRLAATQGMIDPQSGNISSMDQVWQIFQDSSDRLAMINANYYLARRSEDIATNLRYLSLPGPDGALTPTLNAWTWAIATQDTERKVAAADLINWLASADNLGTWTLESSALPARAAAFDVWPDDAYVDFLQRQIANATPPPPGLNNTMLTTLSNATTSVLLGLSSPADAAEQARMALIP